MDDNFGKPCEICGEHQGLQTDHRECSKLKKEIYGASCESRRKRRVLTEKEIRNLSEYYTDNYQ